MLTSSLKSKTFKDALPTCFEVVVFLLVFFSGCIYSMSMYSVCIKNVIYFASILLLGLRRTRW